MFPTASPLPQRPAETLQPPADLRRTPSFRNVRLEAVAHTAIATFPTSALGDFLGGPVANDDLAMLKWEHQERLALAARQREARHYTVQRQAASKLLTAD